MRRVVGVFLLGYLFFLSWTNAFSLNVLTPPHVVFGVLSVGTFICYRLVAGGGVRIDVLRSEDALVGALLLSLVLAAVIHPRETALNYVAAYSYVFGVGYIGIKVALYNCSSTKQIGDWVVIGVMVAASASIAEFVLGFGLGIDVAPYLFRHHDVEALVGGIYPRSTAFSTEPAILAFYLETLGVLSIGLIASRRWPAFKKLIGIVIIIVGWGLTFSAASIVAFGTGILVALSIKWLRHRRFRTQFLPFILIPLMLVGMVTLFGVVEDTVVGDLVAKITLREGESTSAGFRLERWAEGIQKVGERPLFGEGPGTAAARGEVSTLSWYLFLMVEGGIVTALPVFLFIVAKMVRMVTSTVEMKYWFVAASTAGVLHLSVISTFFHPFVWCLFILFDIYECRRADNL